jgi:sugar (pentulose or hexulose) kinase
VTAAEAWLGIDLGTQSVRALLVGPDGEVLGTGSCRLTRDRRTGRRHEQEPAEWWSATCAATRAALEAAGCPAVDAVSIDSTSGTLVVQSADGIATGPALMYDDGRAAAEAASCRTAGGELWDRLGYRMQDSWALPKLVWLTRQGDLSAGLRVAHQADHVAARLTGGPVASDLSHVLKTGYDLIDLRWPAEVLDALGVDAEVLPDVVPAGTQVATVSARGAEASGIPAGTPVRAGMTDGCAGQVAAAALEPGAWCSSLGTTLVLKGSTPELLRDPHGAVYCHRNPDGGWLPGGASSTGAGVLPHEFPEADLDALTEQASRLPVPGAVTYPLNGTGERFPFAATDAHAFGLEPAAHGSQAERFSAALHGIAYVERLSFDVLAGLGADTTGQVAFAGGAVRNRWWNQLRTDVLQRPVIVPEQVEAAVGSAVVAASPPGRLGETARRMVRTRERLEPDHARGERLLEGYSRLVTALVERGWLDDAAVELPTGADA